jgi:hypothetical protein
LPKAVDAVFAKALAKKAPDRFPNCFEFVEALERACLGASAPAPAAQAPSIRTPAVPTPALPTPPVPTPVVPAVAADTKTPVSEPPRKTGSPTKLIAWVVIVLAIVGGAAWWLLFHHSPPAPAETVESPVSPSPPPSKRPPAVRAASPAATLTRPATSQPAASGLAAAESHAVRLVTVPEGVAVTIDNKPDAVCQSPCNMDLTAGKHTLQANKDGYYRLVKDFEVDGQQPEITFTLVQITGSVWIESEPAGASISVDGTPRTEVTPAKIVLPVGQYKVKWTKEGYEPFEHEVTVSAGLSQIKPTLAKSSH